MLRVYALTDPTPLRQATRGADGERLRLVTVGAVAAIVGEPPTRARRVSAALLRRYDEVLRRFAERRPAVLPAQFGTAFDDPEELMFVLRARQSTLRKALSDVRRRAQMTVRVLPGLGILNPESRIPTPGFRIPRPQSRIPDPGSRIPDPGSRYLRERAAAAAREREIPGFDPVRGAVRRWVRGEHVEKRAGITSVYHLVPRASAAAYRRAAERAASGSGLRVIVTGPWLPYAFARWS